MEEVEQLQRKYQEITPLSASAKDFLNVDEEVRTTAAWQTEEEILAEPRGDEKETIARKMMISYVTIQ